MRLCSRSLLLRDSGVIRLLVHFRTKTTGLVQRACDPLNLVTLVTPGIRAKTLPDQSAPNTDARV